MKIRLLFIAITENTSIRGVERYCLELLKSLAKLYSSELEITALIGQWQDYYHELADNNITLIKANIVNKKTVRHLYLSFVLPVLSQHYDIVHYANTLPFILGNKGPSVFTIHDIAEYFVPEKYSAIQLMYRKLIVKNAVIRSDKIITVSHFSKKAILNQYQIPSDKVIVTYNGIDHFRTEIRIDKSPLSNKYFLYFGVIERSKGVVELIKAFQLFKQTTKVNYSLVIAGKKGNAYSDIEELVADDVILLDYIPDGELIAYIRWAVAIVFVSKYEGFGFPALEAFIYNNNIISSNTTALGEITKEFAIQVNPIDVMAIADAMVSVVESPRFFSLAEKEHILAKYSWTKAAEDIMMLYGSMLNKQKY